MQATTEGIERGHLLFGPIVPEGRRYLFTVTRVNGKHSVTAIAHTEELLIEIRLSTNGIYRKDNPWQRVSARDMGPSDGGTHGVLVDATYLAHPDGGTAGG